MLTLKDIRKIIDILNEDTFVYDWKEFLRTINSGKRDFVMNKYRFIHKDDIDNVVIESYLGDEYVLGSFYPSFISEASDLSEELVKAIQDAGRNELIGQHLIDNGYAEDMIIGASAQDGYGAMLDSYDGNTNERLVDLLGYYFWRNE